MTESPRRLVRMRRPLPIDGSTAPTGYRVRRYEPGLDRARIPAVYAAAFDEAPWELDWSEFAEFDPAGVFIAETAPGAEVFGFAGFAICFRRRDHGYVSVVGVVPEHRRRGVASALVRRCAGYLAGLGIDTIRIDAYEDSTPAMACYRSLGFGVHEIIEDPGPPVDEPVRESGG